MAAILTLALGIGTTTAIFTLFDSVLLEPLPVNGRTSCVPCGRRSALAAASRSPALTCRTTCSGSCNAGPKSFPNVAPSLIFGCGADHQRPRDAASGRRHFRLGQLLRALGVRGLSAGPSYLAKPRALNLPRAQSRLLASRLRRRSRPHRPADPYQRRRLHHRRRHAATFLRPDPRRDARRLPADRELERGPAGAKRARRSRRTGSCRSPAACDPASTDAVAGDRLTAFHRSSAAAGAWRGQRQVDAGVPLDTGLSDVRARFGQPLSILLAHGRAALVDRLRQRATLLGARASSRRPEIVISAAIGAGKGRLLRQLATESLVLARGGRRRRRGVRVLGDAGALRPDAARFDADLSSMWLDRSRALAFCVAVSILTAIVAGVAPALRAVGFDLAAALRDRSHGGPRRPGKRATSRSSRSRCPSCSSWPRRCLPGRSTP